MSHVVPLKTVTAPEEEEEEELVTMTAARTVASTSSALSASSGPAQTPVADMDDDDYGLHIAYVSGASRKQKQPPPSSSTSNTANDGRKDAAGRGMATASSSSSAAGGGPVRSLMTRDENTGESMDTYGHMFPDDTDRPQDEAEYHAWRARQSGRPHISLQ